MEQVKNKKGTVIVSHKFLTQPDDDLVLFLNGKHCENLLHICHSFSDAPDRRSVAIWYKNGTEFRRFRTTDFRGFPEFFIYVKEMIFTGVIILWTRTHWNQYIGMDGLCVFWGNLLRFFGVFEKTIYWAIDFVPEKRFPSSMKNKIYQAVNTIGYKYANEVWDLSPRMFEARAKYLSLKLEDYRCHRVVPYGLWLDRIKRYSYEQCDKTTVVFMGHLIQKQGVQLIIDAIPDILVHIPSFRFKIIGEGSFREELVTLAEQKGVLEYCQFHGKIEDIRVLEDEIARSAVAVAPYVKSLDTWTYYADPGKVKSYLGCGVPVLLTDVPWNAGEIEKKECGMIFSEERRDIVEKIVYLLQKENNVLYRKNAVAYSRSFDYKNIFEQLPLC